MIQHFPFKTCRPGQEEAIQFALDSFRSGKKFVLLEGPTGSGKSAIAYTIARHFRNSFYLTSTKILQNQLSHDFGHLGSMAVLKGRNAYQCQTWPKKLAETSAGRLSLRETMIRQISRPEFNFNCSVGFCKLMTKGASLQECKDDCEYWSHVRRALESPLCVMNFDSFLYQTAYSTDFRGQHRDLLCADECHNAESKLLDFVTLTISDKDLDIILEKHDTAKDYAKYFEKIGLIKRASMLLQVAAAKDDIHKADRLENLISKLNLFFEELETNRWISNFIKKQKYRVVEIKPLFVNNFAKRLLFSKADKILMMSATILSPNTIMDSLGIDSRDAAYYKMPNNFPTENRPIHLEPCGSLNYKNKEKTFPKLIKTVDEICDKYQKQKGIIHTHSFEIANLLLDKCHNSNRFLFQKHFVSKDEMLDEHRKRLDSIIVAPAMHEGLDLIDDLSRFQIICKVPYPNQNDNPQLQERVKLSWNYYVWLTALKMVQSYGRSVRHQDDYADTYVIDSDFGRFFDMAADILPDWFIEAIQV